jgi:poly-gamma-glutamate synthesis protein (capsule biosynthesis protein)
MSEQRELICIKLARTVAVSVLAGMLGHNSVQAEPFSANQEPIPDEIWRDMQGKSWHPNRGCPSRERLALLSVNFWDFEGQPASGQLIVSKHVASELSRIFSEIFESKAFLIERMERVDKYNGNDDTSMAANNTSAFNCRLVAGTNTLSPHASGIAIDINPIQNPWVKGNNTQPPEGRPFDTPHKRQAAHQQGQVGIILSGGAAVTAFKQNGWKWGGDWINKKDYQHFSKNGR